MTTEREHSNSLGRLDEYVGGWKPDCNLQFIDHHIKHHYFGHLNIYFKHVYLVDKIQNRLGVQIKLRTISCGVHFPSVF